MRTPDFWYRPPGLVAAVLAPAGCALAAAGRLQRATAQPWTAPVPVICIGNVVAGGAGKTPVALDLLARLRRRGIAAHALSRGHGGRLTGPLQVDPTRHGATEVGDEPLLLAATAPAWVARDRAAGARAAVAAGAAALVLDDGLQNPALAKTLSLLVVDGRDGFGNGRLLPAGPLREPVAAAAARCRAAVVMGADEAGIAGRLPAGLPLLRARLAVALPPGLAAGARVVAFAGIGRPGKFFDSCRTLGLELADTAAFADHHPYSEADMAALAARARAAGAVLVTTAKDQVRLPAPARAAVHVVPASLAWADESAAERLLDEALAHG